MISFSLAQKKNRFQKAKEEKEARRKQDEEEAAKVYESFVESFSANDEYAKTFIKESSAHDGEDEFDASKKGEYRMDTGRKARGLKDSIFEETKVSLIKT
ncbi:hypothetical protein EON64_02975 [archaeon]|nr:MAG: hypothetical protein EON64_02975 [archaeon]